MNKTRVLELLEITLGTFIVAAGFYYFLLPASLVTGGITGLSVLVSSSLPSFISISGFIFIVNIILLIIGGLVLGKSFFMKTAYAGLLLPLFTFLLEFTDPNFIYENFKEGPILLSAIFGGLSVGLGLGLVVRNNATTGGMDIVQKIVHKIFKIPFSLSLYIVDGAVILLGVIFIENGLSLGFYAIGSMIITGVVIDYVLLSGRSGYTVFIVTDAYDKLKKAIYKDLDRGLTKVHVYGGYSNLEKNMIICTVSRNELYSLKQLVKDNDEKAFTFITKTSEALGNGFSYDELPKEEL